VEWSGVEWSGVSDGGRRWAGAGRKGREVKKRGEAAWVVWRERRGAEGAREEGGCGQGDVVSGCGSVRVNDFGLSRQQTNFLLLID
jgi:hypothetical protein